MIKKLVCFITVLLLLSSVGFAQDTGLGFDLVAAPIGLPLDGGEMSFIATQPMIGLTYPLDLGGLDFAPGLYLFGNIAAKNGDDPNWGLGTALGVKIPAFKDAVFGLAYTFIREGDGSLPFKRENLAITVGFTMPDGLLGLPF